MKPSVTRMALNLLVLALLVAGLAGCERSAEVREVETTEPIPTSVATQAVREQETAMPGETVVSAVTPPAEGSGTVVAVTQPPAAVTSTAVAQATPVPTQEAPAPTQASTTGQQGEIVWHTVQRDETLTSIAQRYGMTWQTLAQANGLTNPNQIYVGQKLKIPTGSSGSPASGTTGCRIRHTVKQGEWVWQIARNYGVSPYDILTANGLTIQTADTIYAGMVLCIP
jgi:LysM repeat protein